MFSRQLQRGLVGFCAGVTEKYFVGKGGINQLFGQAQHRLVGITVAQMPKLACLFDQRR
ncbi:hypothetical protein D3C77_816920 [compost metagenome]